MNKDDQRAYRRLLQKTLKEARAEAKMRQEEVARKLGQPQSFVSKYETGERRLDLAELQAICDVLGLTLSELIQRVKASTR